MEGLGGKKDVYKYWVFSFWERKIFQNRRPKQKTRRKDTMVVGATWSLSWSMGRIPFKTISALVEMKVGKTSPGQSQRHSSSSINRV